MNEQDRQAINDLFARLAQIEAQASPMDAEADAYIRQRIAQQPAAPYMMAQTIVVQNQALDQAQQRIQELEARSGRDHDYDDDRDDDDDRSRRRDYDARDNRGGFQVPRAGSVPAAGQRPMGGMPPLGGQPQYQPPQQQGGGFLAGAAQTAMGVAGGMMLGNMLGGMFGGGSTATAAPAPADQAAAAPAAEAPAAQPEPAPAPEADTADAGDEGGIFGGIFGSLFGGGDSGDGDSSFE